MWNFSPKKLCFILFLDIDTIRYKKYNFFLKINKKKSANSQTQNNSPRIRVRVRCRRVVIAQALRPGHGVLRGKVRTLLRMVTTGQRSTIVEFLLLRLLIKRSAAAARS